MSIERGNALVRRARSLVAPPVKRTIRAARSARAEVSHLRGALTYRRADSSHIAYLGWLGHNNLGDEAVFAAVRDYLDRVDFVRHPAVARPWMARAIGPDERMMLLGGGTLIGGAYLAPLRDAVLGQQETVVFGSGVIDPSFPHSYVKTDSSILEKWADTMRQCTHVGVRGPHSQALLQARGLSVDVIGDPICRYATTSVVNPKEMTLGVNVGLAAGRMWGSDSSYVAALEEIVRCFRSRGWAIEYFSVWDQDGAVTERVRAATGTQDSPVHREFNDPVTFRDRTRHLSGFVGVKLHACALAVCAGTPTVALEYQPKIRDFMASVGVEDLSIRLDLDGPEGVIAAIERAVDQRERMADVEAAMNSLRSRQEDFAAAVRQSLADGRSC